MEENFIALGNTIMVISSEKDETQSGIITVRDNDKDKTARWEVLCVWNWDNVKKLNLKKWDKVMFKRYLPDYFFTNIDGNKKRVEVCESQHILAKIV